jgi:hypothetical protein
VSQIKLGVQAVGLTKRGKILGCALFNFRDYIKNNYSRFKVETTHIFGNPIPLVDKIAGNNISKM